MGIWAQIWEWKGEDTFESNEQSSSQTGWLVGQSNDQSGPKAKLDYLSLSTIQTCQLWSEIFQLSGFVMLAEAFFIQATVCRSFFSGVSQPVWLFSCGQHRWINQSQDLEHWSRTMSGHSFISARNESSRASFVSPKSTGSRPKRSNESNDRDLGLLFRLTHPPAQMLKQTSFHLWRASGTWERDWDVYLFKVELFDQELRF